MSWDLYLVPADHGDDVGTWLEEHAEEGHDEREAHRHAQAVLARHPELELGGPYGTDYQLTAPEDSGVPLDVGLYGNHASISVAYWDVGERTDELGDLVGGVAEALSNTTGWVLYDPQDDRIVGTDEIRGVFGTGHAHGVGIVEGLTENLSAERPAKRKRRFGIF
jgi:hypothetical protein